MSLIRTPGHTEEDITTLVETDSGLVAFTHMWWTADGPAEVPYAPDMAVLHTSRERLLTMPVWLVVPGHGAAFASTDKTPR